MMSGSSIDFIMSGLRSTFLNFIGTVDCSRLRLTIVVRVGRIMSRFFLSDQVGSASSSHDFVAMLLTSFSI